MKTLVLIEENKEISCPLCKVVMNLNKKTLHFECPVCTLEIIINKKVIDLMKGTEMRKYVSKPI